MLHQCDTPACVNPDHLFLGTQAENMRDMAAKGRAKKWPGESHRDHKLTEADVRAIRKIAPGTPGVAARYGVSDQAIYAVRKGLTWSHVA